LAVRIQRDDFDIGAEVRRIVGGRTEIGAVVTFSGVVRSDAEGRPIAAIALEHYPDMTEAELARVEAEARMRWALADCLVVHRVGDLRPGDNVVLVVTASAHRRDAFEAAAFLMDYLKTRAPFWKKETTLSGEASWVDARASDEEAAARWDDRTPAK
jgi:molybdopterin synthase catalytic subunit